MIDVYESDVVDNATELKGECSVRTNATSPTYNAYFHEKW